MLIIPLLLIFLTAIIQFGLMFNAYITLNDAVRSGARTLALGRGISDPCDPAISQVVTSAADSSLTASGVTVALTSPDTCGTGSYPSRTGGTETQGNQAKVSATEPFTISVFGLGPSYTVHLTASASDAVE